MTLDRGLPQSGTEGCLLLVLPGGLGREPVLRRIVAEVGPVVVLVDRSFAESSKWARPLATGWIEWDSQGGDSSKACWLALSSWLNQPDAPKILGCTTYDEWGIETCAYLCEAGRLGLPYTSLNTARALSFNYCKGSPEGCLKAAGFPGQVAEENHPQGRSVLLKAQVEEDNTFAEPILELISQASSLSDGCREMLLAMSPHCLKTTKSDRHAYQHQMVEVLTKVVVEFQAENASAARAAEAEVNEMESQQASAAGGTTAAQQAVQHATEERDTRQAAMSSADQVTKVADQALADARNSVANLETERAGMVADKAEYESLIA
ncbi:unnamed protein product, partial [Polarella glacialis]